MVGTVGLEPTTSCTPCMRASQLRYAPIMKNKTRQNLSNDFTKTLQFIT